LYQYDIKKKITNIVNTSTFPAFFTYLKKIAIISISGLEAKKFLQDQLTINIHKLKKNDFQTCGLCNNSGRILSILTIFKCKKIYFLLIRSSLLKIVLNEFKKFSIFYKLKILEKKNNSILGVFGYSLNLIFDNFEKFIKKKRSYLYFNNYFILLMLDIQKNRYLIIFKDKDYLFLKNNLINIANSSYQENKWESLDILNGFPIIDIKKSNKFLPQSINLSSFKGIDYQKGCYKGQEIISITKFKNRNKRFLCCLLGKGNPIHIKIGTSLQVKKENLWYTAGTVLFFSILKKNTLLIQAVLKKKFLRSKTFRINNNSCCIFCIMHTVFYN